MQLLLALIPVPHTQHNLHALHPDTVLGVVHVRLILLSLIAIELMKLLHVEQEEYMLQVQSVNH